MDLLAHARVRPAASNHPANGVRQCFVSAPLAGTCHSGVALALTLTFPDTLPVHELLACSSLLTMELLTASRRVMAASAGADCLAGSCGAGHCFSALGLPGGGIMRE